MPEVALERWNQFLEQYPEAHFLQTGEWGELKSAFGWDVSRVLVRDIGAQVLFRRIPLGLSVGYIPKPAMELGCSIFPNPFWEEVDTLCRQRKAVLCKIEPDNWVAKHKEMPNSRRVPHSKGPVAIASPHSIQPRRTIVVDLCGTEGEILGRMKQKCRYNIGLASRKGVLVEAWNDVAGFHQMVTVTGKRDKFSVHTESYYQRAYELFRPQGMCELLVARHLNQPLAALMVFSRGKRAWYVYGGSLDLERERMPNYLLQWEAMRWAKSHGCEEYDLWGVPDVEESVLEAGFESRQDGLWGVYRFKRGFGGQVRRAAEAIDRVYHRFLYQLYLRLVMRQEGM